VNTSRYWSRAEIGAPYRPLELKGQDGDSAADPEACRRRGCRDLWGCLFLIRDNMRYYGALRLDHVMSLFGLGVPAGCAAHAGAYVHYPMPQCSPC